MVKAEAQFDYSSLCWYCIIILQHHGLEKNKDPINNTCVCLNKIIFFKTKIILKNYLVLVFLLNQRIQCYPHLFADAVEEEGGAKLVVKERWCSMPNYFCYTSCKLY
jgi:hypothetical protein